MKIDVTPHKASSPPGLAKIPEDKPLELPKITRARMWQRARWAKQASLTMRQTPQQQHNWARMQTGLSMLQKMNSQMLGHK